jgi:hypothetical protein
MAELDAQRSDCGSDATSALSTLIDDGIRAEIEALGYHPFILVRLGENGLEAPRFLVCKDQNELAPFVAALSRVADLGSDTLLRGLERALQSEPYEAAEALFAWVQGAGSDVTEKAYIGVPEGLTCRGYYGFPVFGRVAGRQQGGSEERLQLLLDTFEAYDRTNGNNATRFVIMEALGFALSRCLGAQGRFVQALPIVERALAYFPTSIHLLAAKHALNCKINGEPLHPRLDKFVGRDSGHLKQFVCPIPFKRMDICDNGAVLVCCGHWLPTVIGDFIKSPIEDVLNSEKARKIRESMTDGSYKYCSHLNCAPMSQDLLPLRNEQISPRVIRALASGRYDVDGIETLTFGLDVTCNLACPSCRSDRIVEKMSQATEKIRAVEEKLYPLLPHLRLLHINPAGELFASKPARRLLELIDDDRCPELILNIISNGTLFNEKEWDRYPGIHGRVWSVRISTDAATKPTFEKLRRLGNHDVFVENMRFLGNLRRSGKIGMLFLSFTYQLDNFREMIDFVDFVKSVNGDFAQFERLHNNYGTFSDSVFRQKAVHRADHPLHAEFLRVINHPVFRDPKGVMHDFEFHGREMAADETQARRRRRLEMRDAYEAFCRRKSVASAPASDYQQSGDLVALGLDA